VWGIAVAERDPEAIVTVNDFPPMLDITREFVARHGLSGRFHYLPGSLREVDFGSSRFDAAILGNIVHSEGERASRDLFARLHRALAPGGRVAIVDMLPNDDRTGPPFPLFFALNMLTHTDEGDTYTLAEYREWLGAAGFSSVETHDIGSHSPVILATR
jgi:SAM-dependent methyltransferase